MCRLKISIQQKVDTLHLQLRHTDYVTIEHKLQQVTEGGCLASALVTLATYGGMETPRETSHEHREARIVDTIEQLISR